jgi:hypothetical protein
MATGSKRPHVACFMGLEGGKTVKHPVLGPSGEMIFRKSPWKAKSPKLTAGCGSPEADPLTDAICSGHRNDLNRGRKPSKGQRIVSRIIDNITH